MKGDFFLYLPDYHIHTAFCKHAVGRMEEYVESAIELGLEEIGFADHMPVMPEPQLCMGYSDLPLYLEQVRELRNLYRGSIEIRLGCEMDIVPGREGEIRDIIEGSGFDYVIGSVHYLGNWPFDQEKYRDVFAKGDLKAIYDLFFETVIRAANTGLYDIAGHIDNIKRMGYRLSGDMTPYYERAAAVFREMNVAVEVNTSGIDSAAGEAYPSIEFLRILNRHGVPATVGSDSHRPEQVGRHFDRVYDMLRSAGYDCVAYFQARERIMKPLPARADRGASR
jgi:histidinol-phosphatase (PHP family)